MAMVSSTGQITGQVWNACGNTVNANCGGSANRRIDDAFSRVSGQWYKWFITAYAFTPNGKGGSGGTWTQIDQAYVMFQYP
jgi:hypothetical protein